MTERQRRYEQRHALRCDATNPFYSENLKRHLAGKAAAKEKAKSRSATSVKGAEHLEEGT